MNCPVCWGTGYHKGFGAPCGKGCKPPSAVPSAVSWTSTAGLQPLTGSRVFTGGVVYGGVRCSPPSGLYFVEPKVNRPAMGALTISTELKSDFLKQDNWSVMWRYACSLTLGQGAVFTCQPKFGLGRSLQKSFFVGDHVRLNKIAFAVTVSEHAAELIAQMTSKKDTVAEATLAKMVIDAWHMV